jgi:hypothetical protein
VARPTSGFFQVVRVSDREEFVQEFDDTKLLDYISSPEAWLLNTF